MPITATPNYTARNYAASKDIVIAVRIEGVGDLLTNRPMFRPLQYGDPYNYGDSGLQYGTGLVPFIDSTTGDSFRDILMMEGSSLTLSQKLEPEQGRASVTNISLSFIDKDQFMTQLISPGVIIPDILGAQVEVFLGYQGLTFPSDYLRVFRGYTTNYTYVAGKVTLQLSDPNTRRRQQVFQNAATSLSSTINNTVTTIPVLGTDSFYTNIIGPSGGTDPACSFFIKIDDEFIQYDGIDSSDFLSCTRGAKNTTAAAHDALADVFGYIQIQDHAIDMALKLMLSGWNGPYLTSVPISALADVPGVGIVSNTIVLPENKDAIMDYGLFLGDYITINAATNPSNDVVCTVEGFTTILGQPNRGVRTSAVFIMESPSPATLELRSQYDTYPVLAGMNLTPKDVDVAGHVNIKNTWLGDNAYSYRFLIDQSNDSGKTFLESQIYYPFGLYSLTRRGLLSVGITKPPIGGETLPMLTQDNVLNPEQIVVTRGTQNRKYFNEIDVSYDLADDLQTYGSFFAALDADSISTIGGGVATVLPIQSDGARTDLGTDTILQAQANLFLTRYKQGAVQIELKVNWGIGNLIEAGDIVAVVDLGGLSIANINTGQRFLGTQLFEVQDRKLDLATGNISLQLISGVGGSATDRFGVVSPSSLIVSGTTTQVIIEDSYGSIFPGAESDKWVAYVGQKILVHNEDYTDSDEVTFVSQDAVNPYIMNLSPPLSFTPGAGYIVDIQTYPTTNDIDDALIYKSTFAFFDPQVAVVSGASGTQFNVGAGDASKFFVGSVIRVHNADFSIDSGDVVVSDVSGTTIICGALGFTPSSLDFVDLIGFADEGGAYRFV